MQLPTNFVDITAMKQVHAAAHNALSDAINRLLRTKDVVTVDPDGSLGADYSVSNYANASVAINTAITAASTIPSGKRHVKILGDSSTIYTIGDSLITLPSDFTFECSSGVSLRIRNNSSGSNPVGISNIDRTNGNQNIRLINVTGDGNGANQLTNTGSGGIFLLFSGVQGLYYDNVNISNSRRYNSFVNTVSSGSITGTVNLTIDSPYVVGTGTSFTTQLQVGQRIRSGAGNLSLPILRIVDDTHLTLAENWMYSTEATSVGCSIVQGVVWAAKNCTFGKTYEDDSFGGGGWDNSYFDNVDTTNAFGYGFGTTASFNCDVVGCNQSYCGNGWGLERVAQFRFHGGSVNFNNNNGVQLVNGSHNNHFFGVHARGNANDGFHDANDASGFGQNTKNTYSQCKSYENGLNGYRILGVDTPELIGCWAYNNNQKNNSIACGFYFHSGSGTSYLTNNPIVRDCRGFDSQSTPTQTRDINFDTGSQNAQVDFTYFNNIAGPSMPSYSANMNITPKLSGKTVSIISSAARKINPYETTIYCNQQTYQHEFPRLNSIVSGHKIKFIYNGSGSPNWTFIRSSSDSFGTLDNYAKHSQGANFWIEWTWDNSTKTWTISGVQDNFITAVYFNVKSFGAIGDGVTDDTTAITNAVTAALATGNSSAAVYFPAGSYKITSNINATHASGSTPGNGVYLVGDGIEASKILKMYTGVGISWNGSGGPNVDPSRYGGLYNITIDCQGNSGKAIQTNSAQQMLFDRCKLQSCNDTALDLNTTQDTWFGKVMINNCGSTTAPAVDIYGSSSGTSNMLWFDDLRVETFKAGAVRLKAGTGQTNRNNGIYFKHMKLESINARGDAFSVDNMNEDVTIDSYFCSMTGFDTGYTTPANAIYSRAVNKVTFNRVYVNSGSNVVDAILDVQCQNGELNIGDLFLTGSAPVTSLVVFNGNNFATKIRVGNVESTYGDSITRFAYEGTANTANTFNTISQIQASFESTVDMHNNLINNVADPSSAQDGATKHYVDNSITNVVALTDAATVTTDASLGNIFTLTTTQDFTLANPTNPSSGQRRIWRIKQGTTGSHVGTLGSAFRLGTDIASIVLTTTAGKTDYMEAIYNGADSKWDVIRFSKGY